MAAETHQRSHSPEAVARRERRLEEKRRVVLQSTLDLIDEGVLDPTIQQIVERSGTPERSIFRYFDKEELAFRALTMAANRNGADRGVPDLGEGALTDRIDRLVDHRISTLHRMRNLGRAARLRAPESPELDRAIRDNALRMREQYTRHFATELAGFPDVERDAVIDAITAMLTFESYDVQRRRLDRTDDQIARAWTTTLRRLLGPDRGGDS